MAGVIASEPKFFAHAEKAHRDFCSFIFLQYDYRTEKANPNFHPVYCYDSLARYVNEHLEKMNVITIEGEMRSRKFKEYNRSEFRIVRLNALKDSDYENLTCEDIEIKDSDLPDTY